MARLDKLEAPKPPALSAHDEVMKEPQFIPYADIERYEQDIGFNKQIDIHTTRDFDELNRSRAYNAAFNTGRLAVPQFAREQFENVKGRYAVGSAGNLLYETAAAAPLRAKSNTAVILPQK